MDSRLEQSSPIIVTGMHRSGTRLLADVLARLGVFMGDDLQDDSESVTFVRINEALFHQCGTFWSEPMPVHVMLAQPEQLDRLSDLARDALTTELGRYVGNSAWSPVSSGSDAPPFGWKDPRNTFTLPLWRRVFPHCRAIHLVRHGVDVAASLARRQHGLAVSAAGEAVPSPLAVFEDHALGVLSTRRGWTLAEALAMWEQYVEKARLEAAELGDSALEIRFEDLVARPETVVSSIASFCGVRDPSSDGRLGLDLDAERAYAYRRDAELAAFAETVPGILDRYGYSP